MSNEHPPMTTHVSRALRAAVATALQDVDRRWLRDYRATPTRYEAMADAAIAACLPDRAAFENALTELAACAMEWGVHESQGWITADEQERLTNEAADVVRVLVYGTDDAQDGDQEGAEHGS